MIVIDTVPAWSIEVGDQVLLDGDPVEVTEIHESDEDSDMVVVTGYSHESGDTATYELFADDEYDLWGA